MYRAPRLTSVMGVARTLLSLVDAPEAVEVLIGEFGWDLVFQALALLRGEAAGEAFGLAWEHLVTDAVRRDLVADPGSQSM